MSGSVVLTLSLGSLFGALVILAVTVLQPAMSRRSAVARTLALVEGSTRRDDPPADNRTLVDRILTVPTDRLSGLGRRLTSRSYLAWMQRGLDRAGNPDRWPLERIFGIKAAGLIGGGLFGLLVGSRTGLGGGVVGLLVGAATGFLLPDALLYNAGLKRQEQIRRSLAEAMDMLTVCVEAGLGFDAALAQVARKTDGPLARELFRVLQEMQLGTSRMAALNALGERSTVTELQAFVSAVVQADNLGIPIANILREQSKEMRTKRRQRAEEKAQQVPVKILFPMLLFIFPALFVVVIGPGAIQMYHAFTGS